MKFVNEYTGKVHSVKEDCEKEEKDYLDKQKKKNDEKEYYNLQIEKAKENTKNAKEELDKATKEVEAIKKETFEKCEKILEPLVKKMRECSKIEHELIAKYNLQYGSGFWSAAPPVPVEKYSECLGNLLWEDFLFDFASLFN